MVQTVWGIFVAFQQKILKSRRTSWALSNSLHNQDGHLKNILPCFTENKNPFLSFKVLNPNYWILSRQFCADVTSLMIVEALFAYPAANERMLSALSIRNIICLQTMKALVTES